MLELTSDNVEKIFVDCLFDEVPEDTSIAVIAEGVVINVGFNPTKLEEHINEIKELLVQLPVPFYTLTGGGWSFLQACLTKDGHHWGEHRNIDQLLCLGLATKLIEYCMSRDHWKNLPGGMPYFTVLI
jgi:hypothetical protein